MYNYSSSFDLPGIVMYHEMLTDVGDNRGNNALVLSTDDKQSIRRNGAMSDSVSVGGFGLVTIFEGHANKSTLAQLKLLPHSSIGNRSTYLELAAWSTIMHFSRTFSG